MIVRILGEGKFDTPASSIPKIARRYREIVHAVETSDEEAFRLGLAALLVEVRLYGIAIGTDHLDNFDVLLPGKDDTLADARAMLGTLAALRTGLILG